MADQRGACDPGVGHPHITRALPRLRARAPSQGLSIRTGGPGGMRFLLRSCSIGADGFSRLRGWGETDERVRTFFKNI
ncbi:hypothetical protein O181_001520 [Austropuccinia psidii MF-1]|uniref:Uncharacterized protein n=1 Tax=Austropuccinia psidii MF-1 TaxID=1389203 RepID=A0A9Q3BB61_9BASI|nr:hypothetical protein [Austropuccinia psidii MF-1]